MKKYATVLAAVVLCAAALMAANKFGAPKSVIHVVTIAWKADSTPEQQQTALEGVKKMAAEIHGIKNVWIKATRVQGEVRDKEGKVVRRYQAAFVIEFEDQAAAERYADHPAHAEWEKIYLPVREESRSQQITN